MIVRDNFLRRDVYKKLRAFSKKCDFKTVNNHIDQVVYLDINEDIPIDIKEEVLRSITFHLGTEIVNPIMFLRMSLKDTPCSCIHHHDLSHGKCSLILYLNNKTTGGTSLVRHIASGCTYAPYSQDFVDFLKHDVNNVNKWQVYQTVEMKQNRGLLFDAGLMHRAEPVGGFGDTQENGRIVLTCFFSIKEESHND